MSNMKRIAKCYGWLVALSLVAGGASSAYYAQKEPALFEASATVVVGPGDRAANYEAALRSLDTVSRRNVMATYAQVPSSRTVRENVLRELGDAGGQALACRVRASVVPDTNVLRISVQGRDAKITAEFANSVVRNSQELISRIYGGIVTFDILDSAVTPQKPLNPGIARKVGLGALCGLLLSLGVAFLIERIRAGMATSNLSRDQRAERCLGQHA